MQSTKLISQSDGAALQAPMPAFTIYTKPKYVAAAKTLAADITVFGRTAEVVPHLPKVMELCQVPANQRVLIMGAHESENGLVTERICSTGGATVRHHAEFLLSLTE